MTSSIWRALGNTYVVVERAPERLDAAAARALAQRRGRRARGLSATNDRVEIAIWNPRRLTGGALRQRHADCRRMAGCPDGCGADRRRRRRSHGAARMLDDGIGRAGDRRGLRRARRRSSTGCRCARLGRKPARGRRRRSRHDRRGRALLETHVRFPNRTNVQVVRVDGPGEVTARVWERGVGETASSGTSAVAVAAATHGDGRRPRPLPRRRPARPARERPSRRSTAPPSVCPDSGARSPGEVVTSRSRTRAARR